MRRAAPSDVPRLVELCAAMHAESRFRAFPFNPAKAERFLRAFIANAEYIVLVDGEPVHAMFVGMVQEYWWSDARESFDLLLYVLPERRGRGYSAARLVNGYIEIATAMGASDIKIGVSTEVDNERTGRFYERMGFMPMSLGFARQSTNSVH